MHKTHLCFGEAESGRELVAFGPREVLIGAEVVLQLEQLVARERSARAARFAEQTLRRGLQCGCGGRGPRATAGLPGPHAHSDPQSHPERHQLRELRSA